MAGGDESLAKVLHTNTSSFHMHIQELMTTHLSQQPQHKVLQLRLSACTFQVRSAHPTEYTEFLTSFVSVLFSVLPESSGDSSEAGICLVLGICSRNHPDLYEISEVLSQALLTCPQIPSPALLLLLVSHHAGDTNFCMSRVPLVTLLCSLRAEEAINTSPTQPFQRGWNDSCKAW